ncbi:hypothetical protein [Plantibacter sp. YIM 135347]|uniref:hypothetical protein n=1 Tax=Plantibacter sp. YIM 135347 TaxID=3423919 RepID=UPI003D331EE9
MQWWEWAAWAVSMSGAAVGSVLGVRSELRSRYQPTWAFEVGTTTIVTNRTDEDAIDVTLTVGGDAIVVGTQRITLVQPDGGAPFLVRHSDREHIGNFDPRPIAVSWTRRTTGRRYEQLHDELRGHRLN